MTGTRIVSMKTISIIVSMRLAMGSIVAKKRGNAVGRSEFHVSERIEWVSIAVVRSGSITSLMMPGVSLAWQAGPLRRTQAPLQRWSMGRSREVERLRTG